ncbi:MAG: hypothetical protein H7Y27_06930 [Gemmatimonadaceae bacterium]|nr:hypothetical protein [Chitinophagaceae bacterium]
MRKFILPALSAIFIFLFTYTALSKYLDFGAFRGSLRQSPVPEGLVDIIGYGVPAVELVISIMLLTPASRRWGFMASCILMSVFTFYIAYMLSTSSDLPCSCGGIIQTLSWKQHLLLNGVLAILAWLAFKLEKNEKQLFIAINRLRRTPVKTSRQFQKSKSSFL